MSRPAAELERKVGRRVLRVGQVVRVAGERGLFTIRAFRSDLARGIDEVDVYGGPANRERCRTFRVERIGARPRRRE